MNAALNFINKGILMVTEMSREYPRISESEIVKRTICNKPDEKGTLGKLQIDE